MALYNVVMTSSPTPPHPIPSLHSFSLSLSVPLSLSLFLPLTHSLSFLVIQLRHAPLIPPLSLSFTIHYASSHRRHLQVSLATQEARPLPDSRLRGSLEIRDPVWSSSCPILPGKWHSTYPQYALETVSSSSRGKRASQTEEPTQEPSDGTEYHQLCLGARN